MPFRHGGLLGQLPGGCARGGGGMAPPGGIRHHPWAGGLLSNGGVGWGLGGLKGEGGGGAGGFEGRGRGGGGWGV